MKFNSGDKVTLTNAMKKTVRDPNRYKIGTVAGSLSSGAVEVLWGKKPYAVCMREDELVKLSEESQMTLF